MQGAYAATETWLTLNQLTVFLARAKQTLFLI